MAKNDQNSSRYTFKTEHDVLLAVRDHFTPGQYVTLPQVRNGAGFNANRTADALVMSVWPSRGLNLFGIEIKVSRSDWIRELRDPRKADDIAKFCDYWVVAVGDEEIVKDGELPATWGLLVPGKKPGTLRMKVPPTKLEAQPISRSFLAAVLKKTFEVAVPLGNVEAEIKRRVAEQVSEREAGIRNQLEREFDPGRLTKRNDELEQIVREFYDTTGVHLSSASEHTFKRLGKVLALCQWSDVDDWLERCEKGLMDTVQSLKLFRAALPK